MNQKIGMRVEATVDKDLILPRQLIGHKTTFRIEKFKEGQQVPYAIDEWEGNTGLNEGLNELTSLIAGSTGTKWDSGNAYIGVGDSNTAPAAAQTGLQAATNKIYKGMMATYPTSGSSQQIVWKSQYTTSEANWAWEEYTVSNSNSDAGKNLIRGTASKGTKVAGETWTMTITVTFS